jgi:hypothetical protein
VVLILDDRLVVRDNSSLSLEVLLGELAHRHWEKWAFGDARNPLGIAFLRWWPRFADVVVLHGPDHAVTYRAYRDARSHPFAPEAVAWVYTGRPSHAIRNLLLLPPPGMVDAPADVLRLGERVGVPRFWLAGNPLYQRPCQ